MKTLKSIKSESFALSFTRRSVAWVRLGKQRARMRKRRSGNPKGRENNVKKEMKANIPRGWLASSRKRWVNRIWLETVLAGGENSDNFGFCTGSGQSELSWLRTEWIIKKNCEKAVRL